MAQVIGQAIDRIDGRAKVTGTAAYAADNRADRMAFGSIVGATIARGRVAGIDTNAARRMPGVLLVMTHENAPKQAPFQAKADDRHARPKPQLASDKVQYFGQPVALVVAETAEAARAAASASSSPMRRPMAPSFSNRPAVLRTTPARVRPARRPTASSAISTRRSPPRP